VAKTIAALDLLSDGRVIAGVGPGSSERDFDAVSMLYEERWKRFDEAAAVLRGLLRGDPVLREVLAPLLKRDPEALRDRQEGMRDHHASGLERVTRPSASGSSRTHERRFSRVWSH